MKSNRPCKFGPNCNKGDQCAFSHDFSGQDGGGSGNPGPMNFGGGGPKGPSTIPCRFGQNCRKNQMGQCTFLHDNSGQMPMNGGNMGGGGQGGNSCFNCGQIGHISKFCTQKNQNDGGQMNNIGGGGQGVTCFNCGQTGHISKSCPQKIQPDGGGQINNMGWQGQVGNQWNNNNNNNNNNNYMENQNENIMSGSKYPLQMNSLCRNFLKGSCSFGLGCRNKHEYTLKGDIYLKGQFNSVGSIVLIQKLPEMINNRNLILVLSSKQAIIYQETDNENGLQEMYKREIQDQELEATTAYYMNQYLFIALVNINTQKSQILMINLNNNNEFNQTDMHNNKIISILFLDSILVTTASDSKIKFWVWSDASNKFEYKSVHQHQNSEITVIIDKPIQNQKCLLVGDSNGAITVYSIIIAQDSTVILQSQYNQQIHQGPIQSLLLTQYLQEIKFITCSLDGSVAVTDPNNNLNNSTLQVDQLGLTQLINATDFYQKPLFLAGLTNGSLNFYEILSNDPLQNFKDNQYGNLTVHVQQQGGYNKKYQQNNNSVTALHAYSHESQGEYYSYFLIGTQNGTWSYWGFKKPVTG